MAEATKQAPVYLIEIWNSFIQINTDCDLQMLHAALFDLYREDLILCDAEMNRYSLDKTNQSTAERQTEYDLCSDRLVTKFPTYQFDEKCRIVPGPDTPTFNFRDLK